MRKCVSIIPHTFLSKYPAVADCVFLSFSVLSIGPHISHDRHQSLDDHDDQAYAQPPGYQ